jgi:hypothetical protein
MFIECAAFSGSTDDFVALGVEVVHPAALIA